MGDPVHLFHSLGWLLVPKLFVCCWPGWLGWPLCPWPVSDPLGAGTPHGQAPHPLPWRTRPGSLRPFGPCVRFLVGGKVAGVGVQSFPPGDLTPLSLEPHSFEATHGPLSPGKCERVVVSSALILHSISSTQVMQVHGLPESGFPAGFCSEAGWMVHGFCFCLASHSGKGLTLGSLPRNEWMGGGW